MGGMFPTQTDEEGAKYGFFYQGFVRATDDPEKRGRVRVEIPALEDDTFWAMPIGGTGVGPQRGGYGVPPVGSNVVVGFIQGEVTLPFYLCGTWGAASAPTEIPREAADEEPAKAPNVHAYETDTFEVFINENEKKLVLRTKTGDEEIEIDANDRSISLKATNWLIIEAGAVSINGRKIQIAERVVQRVGEPI